MWLLTLALGCEDPSSEDSESPGPGDSGDAILDDATDVVIIGAGPAGLAAAIEAAAAGATVLVLEREAQAGGAANDAGGLMLFSGTTEQVDMGVVDSPGLLTADWPSITGGDPTDPWFQYFANQNVPRVHDWLVGMGMEFSGPSADSPAGSADRIHVCNTGGKGLIALLLDAVPAGVVVYGATAEALEVHEGRVSGVRWKDGESTHFAAADTVIVATGGFLHDLERVAALFPELPEDDLAYGSFAGADGAGLDMLTGLGAATQNLQAVGFYAHGTLSPEGGHEELVAGPIGLYPWLNAVGSRFVDESAFHGFQVGRQRALVPGVDAWFVGDRAMERERFFSPADPTLVYDLEALLVAGIVTEASSLTDLALELALDPATVETSVEAWNAGGNALNPARDPDALPARPVADPPYYAVPVAISVAKAFGGVDVDLDGRVLDTAGDVIPGVYAAGEVSGMLGGSIVGDYGFTGSLSAVLLGGRVAGERAAIEALAR